MPYIGITQDVQNSKILEEVAAFVEVQRSSHRWVHVHCSTPGSSLKNLTQQVDETEADREWLGIMTSVEPDLNSVIHVLSNWRKETKFGADLRPKISWREADSTMIPK